VFRKFDSETLLLDCVLEVNRRTFKVGNAHFVDDNFDTITEPNSYVAIEHALVKIQLVDEPRAAAGLHSDTQTEILATLLTQEAAHLVCSGIGQADAVSGRRDCRVSHVVNSTRGR
jgi:hypothetical protein